MTRAGAVALVVFVLGGAVAAGSAGKTGRLLVTEKVVNASGIYEEGAISHLRVRRLSDGELVVRRRYRGRIRLDEALPARRPIRRW